jgi:hypothetical protein
VKKIIEAEEISRTSVMVAPACEDFLLFIRKAGEIPQRP